MKKTRLEDMQDQMRRRLGAEKGGRVAKQMETEYQALWQTCSGEPEAMHRHMKNNIFPVAAAFRALMGEGMPRPEAAKLASDAFLELMQSPAQSIRNMLKIPGLYRLLPGIFSTMSKKLFGVEAGFRYRFYPTERGHVKFDMLECPYRRICLEQGFPELAEVFCATDDTCYGNMHPKLIWNRSKTLARGGDCCDFDLYIKK